MINKLLATIIITVLSSTFSIAQVVGTPYIFPVMPTSSKIGLDFDGSNDIVTMGNTTSLNGLSAYTIEYWGRFANFTVWTTMLSKMSSSFSANRSAHIQFGSSSGNIYAFIGDSYNYTSTTITPNIWTHIAVVYDGAQAINSDRLKIYFNGVQQPITNAGIFPTTVPSNSGSFTLGTECNTTAAMNSTTIGIGLCDMTMTELRIWNTARTAAQILANKDILNIPLATAGLLHYYKMDHGTPNGNNTGITTLIDSKSGINGTLYNFALTGNISNFIALPF